MGTKGPLTAYDRLVNLNGETERLEQAFVTNFLGWEELQFPSIAHYFRNIYGAIIDTLANISGEEWAKDADPDLQPQLKVLFKRCVKLLKRSARHVRKDGPSLGPVHKQLLLELRRLNQRHDINGVNGLLEHLIKMRSRLEGIRPPAREAWIPDGTDIRGDLEFDRIFGIFRRLDEHLPPSRTQDDYEQYARESWLLLLSACRSLGIPETHADPGENFFDNETRPTYVDFPQRSKEGLYGWGKRPGILALKEKLGGPLLEKQRKGVNYAKKRGGEPLPQGPNKKPRKGSGYQMTLINATADLEDVLRDTQFWSKKDRDIVRPSVERLVTPTCKNRRSLLVAYREELIGIADSLYKKKFKAPLNKGMLPATAVARDAWLKTATSEVRSARALVNQYIDDAGTPYKAKQLRLAAYRLKLARALYMVGLLSGTPAATPDVIRIALRDRLDDWISFERAWSAGDQFLIERTSLTDETFELIQTDIERRDDNIKEWLKMKKELKGNTKAVKEENGGNDDANKEKQEPNHPDGSPVLTAAQIKNAKIILERVLQPRLPGGNYARDEWEEGRRGRWNDGVAAAKLRLKPMPECKDRTVANPFEAGGPPGYNQIPAVTYWERLKYMFMVTFWRFYQLRELDP